MYKDQIVFLKDLGIKCFIKDFLGKDILLIECITTERKWFVTQSEIEPFTLTQ